MRDERSAYNDIAPDGAQRSDHRAHVAGSATTVEFCRHRIWTCIDARSCGPRFPALSANEQFVGPSQQVPAIWHRGCDSRRRQRRFLRIRSIDMLNFSV
jgi:hypothetical protein